MHCFLFYLLYSCIQIDTRNRRNLIVKNHNLIIPTLAMAAVVIASNILVQFLVEGSFVEPWLAWTGLASFLTLGAFTYPVAFLVTDVTNRVYGSAQARKVVFGGLVVGIVCSLIGTQIHGEFGPLVTWRIAVGSATAFLIAQMIDILLFQRMHQSAQGRIYADDEWWKAPLVSSFVGSTLDTAVFFFIAFSAFTLAMLSSTDGGEWALEGVPLLGVGPVMPLWISLAVADWMVKFTFALVALVPFRALTRKVQIA